MALWGGRFKEGVAISAQEFGASLPVDKHLYKQDIAGSMAHARMLAKQGIISQGDCDDIVRGLAEIEGEIDAGTFPFRIEDEDIHMAIEGELTRRIGEAGKRLHTGRSRNDQVATDTRLAAKALARELMGANLHVREVLVEAARENDKVVLPGMTHLQHAQPVLLSHHLLAYYWMFARDFTRLTAAFDAADASPLGAAALAGTSYPLDRVASSYAMGFSRVICNSLDAVSDRDFILDLHFACSTMAMHLSRLAEEIVLWSSSEFGYITLSDAYSTGSSIMPQKKNPDFAELIRGKTGRVYGNLLQLLVTCKGLPLAYNKDLQEDKGGMLDSARTLSQGMSIMAGMISTCTFNADVMRAACGVGHLAATDVADYLVKKGMPFREAHEIVGRLVLVCEERGCRLDDLPLSVFQEASALFGPDIVSALDIDAIVAARTTMGGTAPSAVEEQLRLVRTSLVADEAHVEGMPPVVPMGEGAR